MKRLTVAACLLLLPPMLATHAFGQATGALGGTVEDQTGALIPGAEVMAVNQDTGVEALVITNDTGAYNFLAMQPGDYTTANLFSDGA